MLRGDMLQPAGDDPLVYGNIGLHDTALFSELPRFARLKMLPLWREWIRRGWVSGEIYSGPWANIGTPADLAALDTLLRCRGRRHYPHYELANLMKTPSNPLLDLCGLPRFDAIRPEHISPAIDELVAQARATAEEVATDSRDATWATVVAPLDDALDRIERAWGAVHHLNAVVSTPALRDAYHANLPKITAFYTDQAQDERLYARYKALAASPAFAAEDAARRKLVDNELRDFRLGGADLPPAQKARLKDIEEALADLSARFDDNVLDATNDFALYIDDAEAARLAGIPADVLAAAAAAAREEGRNGWKLTLRMPCYRPVMTYADDRTLRATLHRAYATRASELGAKTEWDNTPIIARILELRREAAQLLGFADFAELSLVPKMAKDTGEVLAFLEDLARRAKPHARARIRGAHGLRTRTARRCHTGSVGPRVRGGKAEGIALRILR